jgi:deoxyribodipyrimidine photo-lyase
MPISRVEDDRIRVLNDDPPAADDGHADYVLYWMQSSQRTRHNPALEHAAHLANQHGLPLVVGFGLMHDYPEANLRHYRFMLEGLRDVAEALPRRNIAFVLRFGQPVEVALELAKRAAVVVTDRGYLRPQKQWRDRLADEAGRRVVEVEGDVVVPVDVASDKREYAARTIRPKINKHRDRFLVELNTTSLNHPADDLKLEGEDVTDVDGLCDKLHVDTSVKPNPQFVGGEKEAARLLRAFLKDRFGDYNANRNQPQTDDVSHMSKYLHFGQVSPVWLAIQVQDSGGAQADIDSYLEEVIVRRELAFNFVNFTPDYDRYSCLPDWAKQTLREHKDDDRPSKYTAKQLEAGDTHDPYWNAAMAELRETGYMHNYMRMYWGKKILEWCNTPQYAHEVTLKLNNKYFIDGRDPNSFSNVAWVFGNHDRPWTECDIFGKVRYMNANGLKRKADPDAYVEKVNRLVESVHQAQTRDA